jgi:hypothetical protein
MQNEKKATKTTDEEITLRLKREKDNTKPIQTTDEEITLQFMFEGDQLTRQPKDYEDIEY